MATINAAGLATGVAVGTTKSRRRMGGVICTDGYADRHRRGAAFDRGDAGRAPIAKGLTQQFTATGTFSDNSTLNITSR